MVKKHYNLILYILWISSISLIPQTALASDNFSNVQSEKATLSRFPDPIVIKCNAFIAIAGGLIENYRVYALQKGDLTPIRFQIDEMSEQDDFVFPFGKQNNKEEGNGILNFRDVLVFMAHDAGGRVPKTLWPKNILKGVEIEIFDPLDQTKAWAYFFRYDGNPPERSSLPDYFTFDYETNTLSGEYWEPKYIITKDGKRTTFYYSHAALPKAGGTGENFVDRLKVRATLKAVFGNVTIKLDEENIESDVIAWIQGPVRVIKRVEQYARGPLGTKFARAISDVQYYETVATVPVNIKIPFKLETFVTSVELDVGTDFAPVVKGSMYYSEYYPKGILIDGKMGEAEKNFNTQADNWRVITGKWGTLMTRNIFFDNKLLDHIALSQHIIDDETVALPPETFPGSIGYVYQNSRVEKLPRGLYTFYLEFYTPPYYKPGDEKAYLNYLDNPLLVKIGKNTFVNQVKMHGKNW